VSRVIRRQRRGRHRALRHALRRGRAVARHFLGKGYVVVERAFSKEIAAHIVARVLEDHDTISRGPWCH
jgi:hypothetical protein